MDIIKFNEKEMEQLGMIPTFPGFPPLPKFNTPITPKENFLRVIKNDNPLWIPLHMDIQGFRPRIIPDNVVCGLVIDGEKPMTPADFSGKGWFDTEWIYVESAMGATTNPGRPQLDDANDWEKLLRFPNIDEYDWEASAKANHDFFERDRMVETCMLCGFYERLISLMDVAGAAMALIDDDQKPAIHAFFDRLCYLYDDLIGRYQKYYNPDIILMHDDWGHQNSTFFSPDTYEEMIVPYIKRITESCHKRGMLYEQHSCGKVEKLMPNMIKAGVDIWQGQEMNDKQKLVEEYGDKILIGVTVPILPPDSSDEVQLQNVQSFIDQYKGKRLIANVMAFDKTQEYTYKLGRIACTGKE